MSGKLPKTLLGLPIIETDEPLLPLEGSPIVFGDLGGYIVRSPIPVQIDDGRRAWITDIGTIDDAGKFTSQEGGQIALLQIVTADGILSGYVPVHHFKPIVEQAEQDSTEEVDKGESE